MMGVRLLVAVLCCGLCQLPVCAQNDASYCNKLRFSIPFQVDPQDAARIREAQLYESVDGRGQWRMVGRIGPNENRFQITVNREGEYWYLLRTVDTSNQAYPAQLDRLPSDVQITKVIVDTTPPRINFRDLPPRGDQVGVSWTVQDENLDLNSLRLDVLSGNGQWTPINITQQARGEAYFTPRNRGRLDVRLSVQDFAKNQEVKNLTLAGGDTADRSNSDRSSFDRSGNRDYQEDLNANRRASSAADNADTPRREPRYVNKDTFPLNFDLEDVGPSGAFVEAFYQSDNQWTPCGNVNVPQSSGGQNKLEIKLPREGNFGLAMMVRSGFDKVAQKPRPATTPEMWVCVDRTPPKVVNVQVIPGRGSNMGLVNISWTASDLNIAQRPIRLEFRDVDDPNKNWQLIEENLENSGRYAWQTPRSGYKFQVRVTAVDKAKNVGEGLSSEVVVDVAQPKVRILDIDH
jgi:hypothetical protein